MRASMCGGGLGQWTRARSTIFALAPAVEEARSVDGGGAFAGFAPGALTSSVWPAHWPSPSRRRAGHEPPPLRDRDMHVRLEFVIDGPAQLLGAALGRNAELGGHPAAGLAHRGLELERRL